MKKIFTLVAMSVMVLSVNAQTEAWSVANADGTLKADYVPNADANAMSVVSFSTANVTGTHTSGPVAGYTDAETLPLAPKVDNSWGNISKKDIKKGEETFAFYYVQGKGNPVNLDKIEFEEVQTDGVGTGMYRAKWDNSYYAPDGSAGLPKNGTYVTLTPKTDGTLKVAVWINKGSRDIYVAKASDAKALALGTDVKASGLINGKEYSEEIATKGTEGVDAYVVGPGNQAFWGYLTFNATANETYYVFNKNTQIGFGGYEFTATGSSAIDNIIADEAIDANAPIYNVYGQRVNKDYKGILIQNGKKFINR